jgi:uncharacterized protein (DUF39 family)
MVKGNLKRMHPRYIRGLSLIGYGCSLAVGVGIPIPILDADMAWFTGVDDCDIFMPVKDYGHDYPNGISRILQHVSFEELKSGEAGILDAKVETVPLTSLSMSLEIADTLKTWIKDGAFLLTEPVEAIPSV